MLCPCKGCSDRYVGCHSKCEKYKEFRAELDALAAKKREFKNYEDNFFKSIRHNKPGRKKF